MRFSQIEVRHLTKAWLMISVAFAIALRGGFGGISLDAAFLLTVVFAAVTVGVGFLAHEIMHKFFAQKYGCWAEFRAHDMMLGLAVLMSFFGFIIAAPGAVIIQGPLTTRKNGIVSLAGPATNIVVGLLFLALLLVVPDEIVRMLAGYGMMINFWLALFNMIPFMPFDGAKVFVWNKPLYFLTVGLCVFFVFFLPALA